MARRVGFNDEQSGAHREVSLAPELPEIGEAVESGGFRWVLIIFLLIWLVPWTGGMAVALEALLDGARQDLTLAAFLVLWLTFAAAGWVFVLRIIFRLLRGRPLRRANPD